MTILDAAHTRPDLFDADEHRQMDLAIVMIRHVRTWRRRNAMQEPFFACNYHKEQELVTWKNSFRVLAAFVMSDSSLAIKPSVSKASPISSSKSPSLSHWLWDCRASDFSEFQSLYSTHKQRRIGSRLRHRQNHHPRSYRVQCDCTLDRFILISLRRCCEEFSSRLARSIIFNLSLIPSQDVQKDMDSSR